MAATLAAAALAGCGDGSADESAATPSARPSVDDPALERVVELADESEVVELTASDGVRLSGREFGSGSTTVVLSHMGSTGSSQEDWFPLAVRLAEDGYRVLTYNRRGVCSIAFDECSEGPGRFDQNHLDVAGAAAYARETGAERVVLGGASIGAMASLQAVVDGLVEPEALVWLAGILDGEYVFDQDDVRRLGPVPSLLVSTRDDSFGAGPDARRLRGWMGDSAELLLLPGGEHGTELIDSDASAAAGELVTEAVVEFLGGLPD